MSYTKLVSVALPALLVIILDDSGSMADDLPGTSDPKFKWTERYLGIFLKELAARSTEVQGENVVIKPRYYVCIIVYGFSPHIWVEEIIDIQTAVEKYTSANNSIGLGGKEGGTDTVAAVKMARSIIQPAIESSRFKDSFPPMVLHLSDGMSHTDATDEMEKIMQLSTSDGNVLAVNSFIGTQTNLAYKGPEDFPGYFPARTSRNQ